MQWSLPVELYKVFEFFRQCVSIPNKEEEKEEEEEEEEGEEEEEEEEGAEGEYEE